jgi:hypothetical protein
MKAYGYKGVQLQGRLAMWLCLRRHNTYVPHFSEMYKHYEPSIVFKIFTVFQWTYDVKELFEGSLHWHPRWHIRGCACTYICTDVYIMYVCTHVCMYVCVCMYVLTCVCVYMYIWCVYVCMSVCMYVCIYVSMYVFIYEYTYVCMYEYTYVCM